MGAFDDDEERVKKHVSKWDQFWTLIVPGDTSAKRQKLRDMATHNEYEEKRQAELEAIKRKRLNAGQ